MLEPVQEWIDFKVVLLDYRDRDCRAKLWDCSWKQLEQTQKFLQMYFYFFNLYLELYLFILSLFPQAFGSLDDTLIHFSQWKVLNKQSCLHPPLQCMPIKLEPTEDGDSLRLNRPSADTSTWHSVQFVFSKESWENLARGTHESPNYPFSVT